MTESPSIPGLYGGSGCTETPGSIALFAPRDRIEFKAPIGELPHEKDRSKNPYSGIASFVQEFDPHSETPAKVSTLGPT